MTDKENQSSLKDEEDMHFGSSQILEVGQTIEFYLKNGGKQSTVLTVLKRLNVDQTIKDSGSTCHSAALMEGANLNNWVKYLVDSGYVVISVT